MVELSEEAIRREAMRLHLSGMSPKEIYISLGKGKTWFFKWLKRYNAGDPEWFKERSKAPLHQPNKTSVKIEKTVLRVRATLEASKYSHVGTPAIQWEMEKMELEPLPAWTIDRVLKRHNAVREKKKYKPSLKAYPAVKSIFSDSIQQADFVGPRYIKGDGRFYSFNVFDTQTYLVSVNPCRTRADENVALSLLRAWKTIGKPDFLQLDNELSFRGSNRYPHSLGFVLRMCLALGVQAIFIPLGEPWRNGCVEKFQDVFDKMFYRSQFFTGYEHLRKEAVVFEEFHNSHHRCTGIHGKTPRQHVKANKIHLNKLDRNVRLKNIDLTLADGYIHFIRFIRSDLKFDVFGEKFMMPQSVKYEYVTGTICTDIHALQIRIDGELIEALEYPMPSEYSRD